MKRQLGWQGLVVVAALMVRVCAAYETVSVGQLVTQKRGFVCLDDECVIYKKLDSPTSEGEPLSAGPDHCWKLNPLLSVGMVTKVEVDHVVVQFTSTAGWIRVTTDSDLKEANVIWDFWGEKEDFVKRGDMDVSFNKSECGKLLSGEMESGRPKLPAQVRLPKQCISWALPRFGDEVVRGPDWNKGSADLQPGMKGRIIRVAGSDEPRGDDGYVTVEWEATKRKGRYRWDCRRKFDVVPAAKPIQVPPAPPPPEDDPAPPEGGQVAPDQVGAPSPAGAGL